MRNAIIEAAQAYYEGKPFISDSDFDLMVEKYRRQNPTDSIFSTPGWGYFPDPGKVKDKHKYNLIGSLGKIQEGNEFPYLGESILLMPKLDGGTGVCYYVNGKLSKIVTRGNGITGVNVTRNLKGKVPQFAKFNGNGNFAVRGEIIMSNEEFETVNSEYSHPRNLAVATAQRLEYDPICELLSFVGYSIVGFEEENQFSILAPMSKWQQLNNLRDMGFEIVRFYVASKDEIEKKIAENALYEFLKKNLDGNKTWPTDGLVLSTLDLNKNLIAPGKNPGTFILVSSDIAYKFKDEVKKTAVQEVIWAQGQTGRLIPKLKIDEIELEGAKINYVTANNFEWLVENGCGVGAVIEVRRANQVVPNINSVIEKSKDFNVPKCCPECGQELEIKYRHLACLNDVCVSKRRAMMHHIWEQVKPDGASDATFERMLEIIRKRYKSVTLETFYLFLQDGNKIDNDNHYDQLINQFLDNWKYFEFSIADSIKFANIPLLGHTLGRRIEIEVGGLSAWYEYLCNGFPSTIFKYELLNEYRKNLNLIFDIVADKLQEPVKQKVNLKVAVTGVLSMPRQKWFDKYGEYGIVKSSVNKDTYCLVTNDSGSGSSTNVKAQKLGVEILNEEQFIERMRELNLL